MASRSFLVIGLVLSLAVSGCGGTLAGGKDAGGAAAAAVAPSLVRVEYTLRYDKGEEPRGAGLTHGGGGEIRGMMVGSVLMEERPLELEGFLVSPTQVVTTDPMIHPRFLEGVAVRQGDEVVKAKVASYPKGQNAVIVELEHPLKGGKPLAFHPKAKPPYLAVTYEDTGGTWTINVQGYAPGLAMDEKGRRFCPAPLQSLITDEDGAAVALAMNARFDSEDNPAGSPLAWPAYTADEMARVMADLEARCNQGLVRVTLHFRSPKKEAGGRFRGRVDEESATENHVVGILLDGGRVLVLANLKPKVTARLEKVVVHPFTGDPVEAKFAASLLDYGCFLATLEKPMAGAIAFSPMPVLDAWSRALPAAETRLQGENRVAYYDHRRIIDYDIGWRRQVYPRGTEQKDESLFLFDPQGALLAAPVAHREKVSAEGRYASREDVKLTPAAYLGTVLADLAKNVDPQNVPLTEAEEQRLAWLGVELQGLNRDLARENKVSAFTRDGETGAIVSYVYPDSPASKAGIEPGWIVLRLRAEGQPKPLEVEVGEDAADRGPFPWDRLDELQEQYFERIPPPWPSAENPFTRALTDLGFGKKVQAECFHDGKAVTKGFVVTASPPHYDSAPRHKAAALGLTVRDLTYEVRRYFQKAENDPGVIVSRIEPGSKASVAGIKPFEMITHVNDKPIASIRDFEKAIPKEGEIRLSVKRMNQGRVVKINMSAPTPAPAEGPARRPAAPPPVEPDEP
ncbi:MAG: PDZ domain-containing protein [Planctomycetota bacterium]|nr:PDZ domain-containing protein [Planctomycetota bacterium]